MERLHLLFFIVNTSPFSFQTPFHHSPTNSIHFEEEQRNQICVFFVFIGRRRNKFSPLRRLSSGVEKVREILEKV
ncbi:hypothetical protein Bca4012_079406 [Brassica carinata]